MLLKSLLKRILKWEIYIFCPCHPKAFAVAGSEHDRKRQKDLSLIYIDCYIDTLAAVRPNGEPIQIISNALCLLNIRHNRTITAPPWHSSSTTLGFSFGRNLIKNIDTVINSSAGRKLIYEIENNFRTVNFITQNKLIQKCQKYQNKSKIHRIWQSYKRSNGFTY